ncbi:MAG TPA: hypothetical protein VKU37_02595 [Verrucomicrobiae bacterium]|nr:hypothetical protein [Verrucomicrobiae bacterium]
MNARPFIKTCLLAVVLTAMVAANTAKAQSNLQAQVVLRPLTAVDISTYGLPANSDYSGGLSTVGIGTPVYLEAEVSTNFAASNILSVVWAVTNKPGGSAATTNASPLGTNVPIYEPSDRLVYYVAGRTVLRPDIAGQYTVKVTITTTSGATNLTQMITAGTYMGLYTCELCHSGGQIAQDKWHPWTQTAHSHIFSDEMDGLLGTTLKTSCLQCHTVGYDTNALALDGGFDDVAAQLGWTIPTVLTNGNWARMQTNYPSLANLANVQCESCHGPGSQHAGLFGVTNSPTWPSISVNLTSGDCNQCHDDATHHPYGTEWLNSMHAITTRDPAGNATCVGCHTATGFIGRIEGDTTTNTAYAPINCQTCHEPHGETLPGTNSPNPYLIRTLAAVTLMDGTVITNAGEGLLCMQCHHSRQNAAVYAATSKGSAYFGPHEGPQADMLEGANGFTYGQIIPSSAHANAVTNTCITCHMQNIGTNDLAFTHAGGHTFNMAYNAEDLVAACQQCHGPAVSGFDFPLQDYNGDGVIQGVQTEVQSLLNKLSTYLPPDNSIKSSLTITSTWTQPQLEAAYNWLFVEKDGSLGIHNTAYAVGLLKASIANLTGDANNDGLPDAWQTNYFGSLSNPNAAPNAINNTNGVPNWMMYALGLDPTQSGLTVPGGVVWMDGKTLVNSGVTNTIAIYTAAEIAFNTQVGSSYQIQAISSLSGGWQNVGNPLPGTGNSISYLTPTRNNVQMFFRVLHNP